MENKNTLYNLSLKQQQEYLFPKKVTLLKQLMI